MKKIKDVNSSLEVKTGDGDYSQDKKNRMELTLSWSSRIKKKAIAIGINPSKANDQRSDNTLTRLARFLDTYGFNEFLMLNIFESYSTDQNQIDKRSKTDFQKYRKHFAEVEAIFVVWGVNENDYYEEKQKVLDILAEYSEKVYCIKKPNGRKPAHPARMGYACEVVKFYEA